MAHQQAGLDWKDGKVPVSTRFDDPYFSLQDGLAETRHVFVAGNGLPARFCDGFTIGELGFGTGLNFLATLREWERAGIKGHLGFTSFEAYPVEAGDMARALSAFPELSGPAGELVDAWGKGRRRIGFAGGVTLEVVMGDARETLRRWNGRADAWYLDGFSPAKNPELWQADLMREVARHTAPDGTLATYTAAGFVRRGLEQAGFTVTRTTGYGRKRHMTRAVLA